jgi:hypothetical protein
VKHTSKNNYEDHPDQFIDKHRFAIDLVHDRHTI